MNYIVTDTETFDFGQFAYDIAWACVNLKTGIIVSRSYLVKEWYEFNGKISSFVKNGMFSKMKTETYEKALANGEIEIKSIIEIREQFMKDIADYKIDIVTAFNSPFDQKSLNNTMMFFDHDYPFTYTEWKDLAKLACNMLLNKKPYFKFAIENGLVSDKGNVRTTAEATYKYISKDVNFEEAHIAYKDVEIEAQILLHILTKKKKLEWDSSSLAWQIPQKKFHEMVDKMTTKE